MQLHSIFPPYSAQQNKSLLWRQSLKLVLSLILLRRLILQK